MDVVLERKRIEVQDAIRRPLKTWRSADYLRTPDAHLRLNHFLFFPLLFYA